MTYALSVKLKPGLIKYKVEFGTTTAGQEKVERTVENIVCGDAYIIDGQSNALATDTREESPPETSEWIRSYGRPPGNPKDTPGKTTSKSLPSRTRWRGVSRFEPNWLHDAGNQRHEAKIRSSPVYAGHAIKPLKTYRSRGRLQSWTGSRHSA